MTNEEITSSLDAMLVNPKAKNFLNHMVRSYFPTTKIVKVETAPEGPFKCALTRKELVLNTEANKNLPEAAFTGKDTNTFLSAEGLIIFSDWVIAKSFNKDKHINWLLNGVKRTDFIERATQSNNINGDVKEKAFKLKEKTQGTKSASFKLGDANAGLAALKAKLEAQGC
jgi:hypothetical protein